MISLLSELTDSTVASLSLSLKGSGSCNLKSIILLPILVRRFARALGHGDQSPVLSKVAKKASVKKRECLQLPLSVGIPDSIGLSNAAMVFKLFRNSSYKLL